MHSSYCSGMRVTRRLTYQASRPAARTVNTLLVGDDSSLASAVQHVELFGDVKLIGLVTEDEALHGLRVGGVPVLGAPSLSPACWQVSGLSWSLFRALVVFHWRDRGKGNGVRGAGSYPPDEQIWSMAAFA